MKERNIIVGAFEAKTHLSSLLKEAQKGGETVITIRGKPVARLIPFRDTRAEMSKKEVISKFIEIRQTVKGKVNIKEFMAEGRKH